MFVCSLTHESEAWVVKEWPLMLCLNALFVHVWRASHHHDDDGDDGAVWCHWIRMLLWIYLLFVLYTIEVRVKKAGSRNEMREKWGISAQRVEDDVWEFRWSRSHVDARFSRFGLARWSTTNANEGNGKEKKIEWRVQFLKVGRRERNDITLI